MPGLLDGAGWVGWLEYDGTQWRLQREWTGDRSFASFGWSLELIESENEHIAFVGIPEQSKVQELIIFEKIQTSE